MPFIASLRAPAGLRQVTVRFPGEAEIEGALNWDCLGCLQDLADDFDVVPLSFFVYRAVLREASNKIIVHSRCETLVQFGELYGNRDSRIVLIVNKAQGFQ